MQGLLYINLVISFQWNQYKFTAQTSTLNLLFTYTCSASTQKSDQQTIYGTGPDLNSWLTFPSTILTNKPKNPGNFHVILTISVSFTFRGTWDFNQTSTRNLEVALSFSSYTTPGIWAAAVGSCLQNGSVTGHFVLSLQYDLLRKVHIMAMTEFLNLNSFLQHSV